METVSISKDEYIELLRCKANAVSTSVAQPPRKIRPRSWMTRDEIAEVLRLHTLGYRPGEICMQVGRPASTVSRCIRSNKEKPRKTGYVANTANDVTEMLDRIASGE